MNLSEELKYLSSLLDSKLISKQSVGERLEELARREKDRPYVEMNDLLKRAGKEYLYAPYTRDLCDCGVSSCTYLDFRHRHLNAVIFSGSCEPLMPFSHLTHMKEVKQKLEERKKEAQQRATEEYNRALNSIYNRYEVALKKAEEMK